MPSDHVPHPPPEEPADTRQVTVRLPTELLDRVEAHLAEMRHAMPGIDLTRTDAIRSLIQTGLRAA